MPVDSLDPGAMVRDLARLVRVPSVTGRERPAMELFAELAEAQGLEVELMEHDLGKVRAAAGYPGEEAPRDELVGVRATLRGRDCAAPPLALAGHLDVVNEGSEAWEHDPWSGEVADGWLYGRGAVDMKAGVIAALHALGAVGRSGAPPACDVALLAVASEEDGGLGAFAALEHDSRYSACLIPEPTGFELVCAQAGAATFSGRVHGKAAHAALRLEGVSAIDRYVRLHHVLQQHERRINEHVEHPLMSAHPLPYPVLVGRLSAGRWSSQVPDLLEFEGRLGVPVGTPLAQARDELEQLLTHASDGDGPPPEIAWTGGQFASAETDSEHPFVRHVSGVAEHELGAAPRLAGVTWGSDMRHFTERGIPTVMFGTRGIERAHAVDERVSIDECETLARILIGVIEGFAP